PSIFRLRYVAHAARACECADATLHSSAQDETARAMPICCDVQVLQCTDPSELKDAPEEGAYVYGLFLEGAGWDKEAGVLCEQAPRELLTPLPVMWLRPVSSQGGDGHGASHASPTAALPAMTKSYACPVYRTAIRRGVLSTTGHSTMWVMNVQLPMSLSQSEDHFVKRSTALLCQTSD
ncbi:hypothetical protein EON66_08765, partial [archaeon]